MLIDIGHLLGDDYDSLEEPVILKHVDQCGLELIFENELGFLSCLVLPLDDLGPDLHSLLDTENNKVQDISSLASLMILHIR